MAYRQAGSPEKAEPMLKPITYSIGTQALTSAGNFIITLAVVQPGLRLGTFVLRPAAATGWNEMAEGWNSTRVFACTICREMYGAC